MGIRKNQASLSPSERRAFVTALLALKNTVPSKLGLTNRYDDYVRVHADSMMTAPGWAHRGPAFGPWHRAFIRDLERDLQAVDPGVSLPYWDWTADQSADPAAPGSPWSPDFLGGNGDPAKGGKVMTGPFAFDGGKWRLNVLEHGDTDPFLVRAFGRETPTLPTAANVSGAMGERPYDAAPWASRVSPSFRDRLEGWHGAGSLHNRVHLWVGGSMLPMTSPNDPVFFLHHCNVDRLWAQWQKAQPQEPYLPADGTPNAPQGHRLKDPMQPWGGTVTPQSTLNHHAMGYQYDSEPAVIALAPPAILPAVAWTYQPDLQAHLMSMGPMFDLSAEDKKAGGHDQGPG